MVRGKRPTRIEDIALVRDPFICGSRHEKAPPECCRETLPGERI